MERQRWIDPAGILQLVGMAAVFAGIAISVASLSAHPGPLPMIVIGVAAAAAGVLVQFSEWERQGGRAAIVATNTWIRARSVPSAVPRETWMPRLRQREAQAVKQRWFALVIVIQMPLSVFNLLKAESMTDRVLWICALVFWAGLAAWMLHYNLRVLPVIRRLLRQPHASDARAATDDRAGNRDRAHVHHDS